MISTVDPDARHAHKTQQRRQDGFKAHIVVEPDTGLTTATGLTRASGPDNSDATVGADLVTTDPTTTDVENIEVLGDSAYATGDMLATLAGKQWLPLVKPWPTRPAVEGGFGLDDFTFDAAANTLTCPADVTRTVSPQGRAKFGAAGSLLGYLHMLARNPERDTRAAADDLAASMLRQFGLSKAEAIEISRRPLAQPTLQ